MNIQSSNFAIQIQNLTKIYQSKYTDSLAKNALNSLNLNITKGRIFGLLGPNGAGKSTLINILAGIVNKTSGQINVMGYDIDLELNMVKRQIGIVPQEIHIDNFFSIKKLLEFTAGYYGISPKNCDIDGILKILGLYDKRNNTSRQLSGGMKRRMIIAKSMVHSPPILILDEPTAGVDIDLRVQLWNYIKKLNKQGITIIITTHYLEEAQELCDEIAFIDKGTIIKQDMKNNLLNNLGSKNLHIEFSNELSESQIQYLLENKFELVNNICVNRAIESHNTLNLLLTTILSLNLPIKDIQITKLSIEDIFRQLITTS